MKQKRQKPAFRLVRALGIIGLTMIAGGGLAAQFTGGHLAARVLPTPAQVAALVIPKPTPKPTPTPTPAATPAAAPAATPKPAAKRRVAVVKQLPAVKPAPNSAVDKLVPVSGGAAPTPTPVPSPGLGSAGPSPSPTPALAFPNVYYTSTNWAGYMSPAGNFTAVSGSWVVPNPTGNGVNTSMDAAWIGIGGVTSGDLIQTGTSNFVSKTGVVTTIAFYELLPDAMISIPSLTVRPGDLMSADIHRIAGTNWQINLTNVTTGQTFSINVTYNSSLSTAEWIQEDPSFASGGLVPFDFFGSVPFTNSRATSNGVNQTAAALGAQAIVLVNGSNGQHLAVPSLLNADGMSFTVVRK